METIKENVISTLKVGLVYVPKDDTFLFQKINAEIVTHSYFITAFKYLGRSLECFAFISSRDTLNALESLQKLSLKSEYFIPMHFVTLAALVILGKEPQTVPGIPVLDTTQVIYNVPWLIRSSSTGRAVYLRSTCTAKMQHSTHR